MVELIQKLLAGGVDLRVGGVSGGAADGSPAATSDKTAATGNLDSPKVVGTKLAEKSSGKETIRISSD